MLTAADLLKTQLKAAQTKFGRENCYVAADHWIRQFGVPLPSLALQYMFAVQNLPLGRFYGFRGKTQSFKSSMVFYLLRIIMEYGGATLLVETENKASDTLMEGLVGPELFKLMQMYKPNSVEEAQDYITFALDTYKKLVESRHLIYGVGWDSLRGTLSEATSKNISKAGHYEKTYSAEAHALSPYFAKLVEELNCWPVLLFFVQHEKKKMAEGFGGGTGNATSALGGDAPEFHSTVLTRSEVLKSPVRGAQLPYADLRFQTVKNNLGIKGRRCDVTLYFRREVDEHAKVEDHIYEFDWDTADCNCLLSEHLENKQQVKEVLALEEFKSQKGFYKCTDLGLDKATAKEVMEVLKSEEHAERYDELRRRMHITKNLRFDQVEWTKVDGTDKKPIMDWAIKEGVDLTGIRRIEKEDAEGGEEA